MYNQKNKTLLEKSINLYRWVKRKIIVIIAAIMIGVSNVIYEEDKMIETKQNHIEQEQEKD